MREVRIYPSNLTRTYKGRREKDWERENRVGGGGGGGARENLPTQEKTTRGGRVAFPHVR